MGDIFGYIWGEYACVRLIYLNIFDVNTLVSAGYICGQMLTGNRWINMAGDRYMQTDLYTNVMQGWIILVLSFGFKWFANVKKNHSRYVFFWGSPLKTLVTVSPEPVENCTVINKSSETFHLQVTFKLSSSSLLKRKDLSGVELGAKIMRSIPRWSKHSSFSTNLLTFHFLTYKKKAFEI